jgi:predicted dehydrogenase
MSDKLTRRSFLAVTTTTTLAGYMARGETRVNTAQVVPGKVSPNEKINVAGIGVGGKGYGDIMECRRENVVALCDVDWERAGEAFYKMPDAVKYKSFFEMLEKEPSIDAVTVSTPDHTHAIAAYTALKAGKHVYCQKPLTQTVAEARLLTNTARELGLTTQMGNQGHCGDGVRETCEIIWSGGIGAVKEVHIWTNRPIWPQAVPEALPSQAVPADMQWDLWLSVAPWRAYNADYAPFNWRGWWDFGAGALGDMGCHIMDPANWALKLQDAPSFSVEVVQQEGNNLQTFPSKSIIKYTFPARADMGPVDVYWYDGGLLPERPADIPADLKLGDGDNGSLFVGEKGYLACATYGENPQLLPEANFKDYKRPEQTIERIRMQNPYVNWLDGIKNGTKPASNFEYSGPFTEVVVFGNVALASGKRLEFDRASMKVTNDEAANALLTKQYRRGWELPV